MVDQSRMDAVGSQHGNCVCVRGGHAELTSVSMQASRRCLLVYSPGSCYASNCHFTRTPGEARLAVGGVYVAREPTSDTPEAAPMRQGPPVTLVSETCRLAHACMQGLMH